MGDSGIFTITSQGGKELVTQQRFSTVIAESAILATAGPGLSIVRVTRLEAWGELLASLGRQPWLRAEAEVLSGFFAAHPYDVGRRPWEAWYSGLWGDPVQTLLSQASSGP